MPSKKKNNDTGKHAGRFANKAGKRWKKFAEDARSGNYDGKRLAGDVASSLMDAVDLWTGLLGYGASPQVGVAIFSGKSTDWKVGRTATLTLADPVPDGATFPAKQKLRTLDGSKEVDLEIQAITIEDDDGFDLKVTCKDVGAQAVPAGEYAGNLLYQDVNNTKHFLAIARGTVEA